MTSCIVSSNSDCQLWKKFWKQSPKFFTIKSSVEKSLWIKKSLLFWDFFPGLFFWCQYDFIQKSPLIVENAWEQRMFSTMGKKGLILKTLIATFNMQMHHGRKVLFYENFSDFLWSYFLALYWQSPYYFREKSPRNLKLWSLFPVTFCSRTTENWGFYQSCYIRVF